MPSRITLTKLADENHAVHTIEGGRRSHRRRPCGGCPWLVQNIGGFPAEAFRLSANTAYDASLHQFACHESGLDKPATCAGFLLRNAYNNIGTRLAAMRDEIDFSTLEDPGDALFASYREMAVANGVFPDDPVLAPCGANFE